MKREFLLLAQTYDEAKHRVNGWMLSTKMDGIRAFWDGGITRGMPVKDVPFANTLRDDRFINQDIRSTGLWSRNAKVIRAPEWFLNKLPKIFLDGEIWAGIGKWEVASSITGKIVPIDSDWKQLKYCVFDSPPARILFGDGIVDTEIYYKHFNNFLPWINDRAQQCMVTIDPPNHEFEFIYSWLKNKGIENDFVCILEQTQLPYATDEIALIINQRMDEAVAQGNEGLMVRKHESYWAPERSWNLLKIKKWYDDEAIVVGYTWGSRTTKGSKLLGKMGALLVAWKDKYFEISGFNYAERDIVFKSTGANASVVGYANPEQTVSDDLENRKFPRGSKITFRYRELTAKGIPSKAQYYRKPNSL